MNYKQMTLALIVGSECLVLCFFCYKIYSNIKQKNNNLWASRVIHINKNLFIFPKEASYSGYFEPKPNSVQVDPFPWSATGSATYTINADTLNDLKDYPVEKTKGVYRIITLGDSFTFGLFVNTANNWPSLLENKLNQTARCAQIQRYEVINLGVAAYDIDFAAERYRVRGQKYNPDLVIWFLNNFHFYLVRSLFNPLESEINNKMSSNEKMKWQKQGEYYPAGAKATEELFQKYPMARLVELEKKGLYVFTDLYKGPLVIITNGVEDKYLALLTALKNSRRAPTYIFQNITQINSVSGAAFPDTHPTPLGHALYARDIYQYLMNQRLLCR